VVVYFIGLELKLAKTVTGRSTETIKLGEGRTNKNHAFYKN